MSLTQQQKNLLTQPYPVSPLHQYYPPWPPSGGTALSLATILAGNLTPIPFGQNPLVLPQVEWPPSGALFFRFAPGTSATQIQQSSWKCRRIIFSAPGPTADSPNSQSVYVGTQGLAVQSTGSMEVPPGGAGTWNISDVITAWFIAQNSTDIITGWAESVL